MYVQQIHVFIYLQNPQIIETVFPVYNKKSNTCEEGDELKKQTDKLEKQIIIKKTVEVGQ